MHKLKTRKRRLVSYKVSPLTLGCLCWGPCFPTIKILRILADVILERLLRRSFHTGSLGWSFSSRAPRPIDLRCLCFCELILLADLVYNHLLSGISTIWIVPTRNKRFLQIIKVNYLLKNSNIRGAIWLIRLVLHICIILFCPSVAICLLLILTFSFLHSYLNYLLYFNIPIYFIWYLTRNLSVFHLVNKRIINLGKVFIPFFLDLRT